MTGRDIDFRGIALSVLERQRSSDFAGWDPFDGLNSRLFGATPLARSRIARLAWLQFHKRSFVNFRRLAAVPKVRNPKGLAVMILGLLALPGSEEERASWRAEAAMLGDWLIANACDRTRWGELAWGYPFDWQARAFFVPRGTPNAITTVYCALALEALGEAGAGTRFTAGARAASEALDRIFHATDEHGPFYRYIPGDPTFVHNASLWVAAVVAAGAAGSGDATRVTRALGVARRSAAMQESDGSWRYGTRSHHAFKDSFHTGYNLEALTKVARALHTTEFDDVIARGLRHFCDAFVLPDGRVRYFHDRDLPLDTHACAEAVVALVRVGRTPAHVESAKAVASFVVQRHLHPRKDRFAYQSGRYVTNWIEYARWTQAWAFYAMAIAAQAALRPS